MSATTLEKGGDNLVLMVFSVKAYNNFEASATESWEDSDVSKPYVIFQ